MTSMQEVRQHSAVSINPAMIGIMLKNNFIRRRQSRTKIVGFVLLLSLIIFLICLQIHTTERLDGDVRVLYGWPYYYKIIGYGHFTDGVFTAYYKIDFLYDWLFALFASFLFLAIFSAASRTISKPIKAKS